MFDEQDYYSDQEDTVMYSHKNVASSKVLVPSSGSDFNNMTGDGESLFKMMKDRGFDLSENEIKKMKDPRPKDKSQSKTKAKPGFFDGGDKASIEELVKALNKAFSKADPQQASCILSYILDKKSLTPQDRNKYAIMKCNILFGLGAYQQCLLKSQSFLQNPYNKLSAATFSNLMAKCKSQLDDKLSGYIDYLRAKSLIQQFKQQSKQTREQETEKSSHQSQKQNKQASNFAETDIDVTTREINHTELEYNIKMSKYKNNTNLIYPYFPQFRHRKVLQVVCGDYHTLFLTGGGISNQKQNVEVGPEWNTEVFGIGQNTVGQITGLQRQVIYKEPVIVSSLSGKGIQGIWASKQSSLAYDAKGNIYQWGIKSERNDKIEVTYTVNERIRKLEKGYKHYALVTESGKFYSWGLIEMKGAPIYNQAKPHMQDSRNIVNFSCGNSHTIAIDSAGSAYALGSNDLDQLCLPTQRLSKKFQKINNNMLGQVRKVFCIQDTTFFVTEDCEIFFCGRFSYNKQAQGKLRQAQFADQFRDIVSISGSVGTYYVTNQTGSLYKWDVDNMVKFKQDKQNQTIKQRYICGTRASVFRVRSTLKPQACKIKRMTQDLRTYQPISYKLTLCDAHGLFGLPDFTIPPKCQVFLSTYKAKQQELKSQNKSFLQSANFCTNSDKILLNQIIENRLLSLKIIRDQEQPWYANLSISVQSCGKYYFYVIIDEHILLQEQLDIQISEREKELQQKNRNQRLLKEQQRRRKAELQKQRRAQEKLRKEMQQEQKRKQTQRRAEEALKKHMREQEEEKNKIQEQRRARKELQTGGGFDLNKLKKKSSVDQAQINQKIVVEKSQRSQKLQKTGQSFLPDINKRPSSRKKMNLPKPSQLVTLRSDSQKGQRVNLKASLNEFSSTGFTSQKPSTPLKKQQLLQTNSVTFKRGGNLVRKGLSKKKN